MEQRLSAVWPLVQGQGWWRLFEALANEPDFEYLIIDSTIVRAHQHATGKKGGLKIAPLVAAEAD